MQKTSYRLSHGNPSNCSTSLALEPKAFARRFSSPCRNCNLTRITRRIAEGKSIFRTASIFVLLEEIWWQDPESNRGHKDFQSHFSQRPTATTHDRKSRNARKQRRLLKIANRIMVSRNRSTYHNSKVIMQRQMHSVFTHL